MPDLGKPAGGRGTSYASAVRHHASTARDNRTAARASTAARDNRAASAARSGWLLSED